MMEIKAEPREITGKKVRGLRKQGLIPAVLYGNKSNPLNISVEAKEFNRVFGQAGETSILNLAVGKDNRNVLIYDVARHPLSGEVIHADFLEVNMTEKITTEIPLVFIGESEAVKSDGGILMKMIQEIEVEALPGDLPKEFSVDISGLKTFEDKIYVRDLKAGKGVEILVGEDEIIAFVAPPRSEDELKELDSKPAVEIGEIEIAGKEEKAEESAEA